MNTAGGKVRESSILEAAKTIKLGDFRELHKKPCARESFLVGIGAGFGVGGLRAVMGGLFFLPIFSFFFLKNLKFLLKVLSNFRFFCLFKLANRYIYVYGGENSTDLKSLQLGRGYFCLWVLFHARILSEEEVVGDSGAQDGGRVD